MIAKFNTGCSIRFMEARRGSCMAWLEAPVPLRVSLPVGGFEI